MYTPIINDSKHYGNNRWFAFSPRLQRGVKLYSDLEYDNWILIEMNPVVDTFCEQPIRIRKGINGRCIESIPDMWIRWVDGKEMFIEVKYSSHIEIDHPKYDGRTALQLQCQNQWCLENGYDYRVHTEKEIRKNPVFLSNMKILLPYLRHHSASIETDNLRVLRVIAGKSIKLPQLLALTEIPSSRVIEALIKLYLDGKVLANFDSQPLGINTEVWVNVN